MLFDVVALGEGTEGNIEAHLKHPRQSVKSSQIPHLYRSSDSPVAQIEHWCEFSCSVNFLTYWNTGRIVEQSRTKICPAVEVPELFHERMA
jgi:hypothetical protein